MIQLSSQHSTTGVILQAKKYCSPNYGFTRTAKTYFAYLFQSFIIFQKETRPDTYMGNPLQQYCIILRIACTNAFNILKVVCHLWWSAQPLTGILLYKALTRSRLEYAGHLTASACNTQWKRLERNYAKPVPKCKLSFNNHLLIEQTNLLYQKTLPAIGYWSKKTSPYCSLAGQIYSTSKHLSDKTQLYRYILTLNKLPVTAPNQFSLYTDGSKSGNNVGSGFYSLQCRLSKAPLHFHELTHGFLIFLSDSRAVLLAIQSQLFNAKTNWIIIEIKKNIHTKKGIAIKLVWIPGHCNITGNDKADKIAKEEATSGNAFPLPLSLH
ncbi:hypothetical protein B566_EDAN011271 [Ephemera danica]|nr:hypothetical protein B566_EDAN011271 [Ephemera danica]